MIKTDAKKLFSKVSTPNKFLNSNPVKISNKNTFFSSQILHGLFVLFIFGLTTIYSQTGYSPNNFTPNQPGSNYMANSSAFKQEIAKMEINVVRAGKDPLPLTRVPRLEKNDILKVRMLEDQVNGMKPDQSNWNWTFLVAFINPGRNNEKDEVVSEEIQFRKSGWYKEYSFTVPYDCQPMFFLYAKPNYKGKILNLVSKNQDEIRKIGEKTIELSGAYAKISSFLNELQYVVNSSTNGFSNYGGGSYGSYGNSPYGTTYGGGYGSYGGAYGANTGFNANLFMNQTVERLARSFNIQLPNNCGQYNGYSSYGGTYGNQNNFYGVSPDFIGRTQCVAKSVRLEDFDFSVSRLLQQGGILATAQLTQKYPQLAFWINIAAAALEFINKINKKAPLRIVPTVIASTDSQGLISGYQGNSGYQANYVNNFSGQANPGAAPKNDVKITLYAESAPSDTGFVTAYPLVVQKWQASPDPEVISLPKPVLAESCLHAGMNILKSTDLITDWMSDKFTTDFKLVITSHNGFHKEFPLKKNIGFNGWELNITKEELENFPKINIELESVITGRRGFNDIESPKFQLPIPMTSKWEISPESQKAFAVGEKRTITLRNPFGNCRCLQTVTYKPSFGGQFIFDSSSPENTLLYSEDGKEVSFIVDAANFQPGQGQLELRQVGGEVSTLAINLYPAPPEITDFKIARGDNKAVIYGLRLDQLQAVKINGKRAIAEGGGAATNFTANQNAPGVAGGLSAYQSGIPASYSINSEPSEKTFVFEDSNAKQDSSSISLELELTEGRNYKYPGVFSVTPSRPLIVSSNVKEVEGVAIVDSSTVAGDGSEKNAGSRKFPFVLTDLTVFPVSASKISVDVQNALTDYDFKVENIQIETKIENTELNREDLPKVNFEVLDWKTMKIVFQLNDSSQRVLGGRRLQFRIRDKIRGISDWYTVSKTFARMPEEITVNCAEKINSNCQMSGEGIQYINQVSVDGGKTWYPQDAATSLQVQTKPNGQKTVLIPYFTNKSLLKIKLRDFTKGEGMSVNNYVFSKNR